MCLLLTFVIGQVSEVHRFTDLLVRGSAQLHLHSDRFHYGGVTVGRSLEDDGHLAMDIGLGEGAPCLPAIGGEESYLDVIWRKGGMLARERDAIKSKTDEGTKYR